MSFEDSPFTLAVIVGVTVITVRATPTEPIKLIAGVTEKALSFGVPVAIISTSDTEFNVRLFANEATEPITFTLVSVPAPARIPPAPATERA